MKKLFSILLSIVFALCLFSTLLLSIVRSNLTYSALIKMAGEMMKPVAAAPSDGLFHIEDRTYSLAQYEDFEDFDFSSVDLSSVDLTNMDVNEIVQAYIKAAGVDVEPEFVAEVLSTPEVSEFVDKYVGEIVDYVTGQSQELSIDTDDIVNVMNKSFDMYEAETGEVIERSGMKEIVESSVEEVKVQIESTLDTVKEENAEYLETLKQVEFFLSLKFFLICIGLCVFLALIILLINRNVFAWLQYVFMPAFIDGLLIFIIACIAKGILPGIIKEILTVYQLPGGIFEGIWSLVSRLLAQMKLYGIIATIAGFALWLTGLLLGKKSAKKAA